MLKICRCMGIGMVTGVLGGCAAEGIEGEPAAELQQAVAIASACQGVTAQPPAAGRYEVLRVKAGTDTTIRSAEPDRHFSRALRCESAFDAKDVCLLRFPIDLPETAQIHFAQLKLRTETTSPATYRAYTMDKRWTESGATWNSYSTGSVWTAPGARSDIRAELCALTSAAGVVTYNLSGWAVAQIQDWVSSRAENSGIGLFADRARADVRLSVFSSEGLAEDAPELMLWYTNEPVASQTVRLSPVAAATIDSRRPDATLERVCEAARDQTERSCLLLWDTSQIPAGSLITRVSALFGSPRPPALAWQVYPVRQRWVAAQATWNHFATRQSWGAPGASSGRDVGGVAGLAPAFAGALWTAPETYEMVQGWIDDAQSNRGVLLAGSRSDPNGAPLWTVSPLPILSVTFTPP